ncbi:MAG: hypothetical protein ACJATL_001232 [Rickettsiales bacterium]|jgi:hypothetical protein
MADYFKYSRKLQIFLEKKKSLVRILSENSLLPDTNLCDKSRDHEYGVLAFHH